MKKKFMIRFLLGLPIGLSIDFIICLVISACFQDGNFYAVAPSLISAYGSELNATLIQAILYALYGGLCSGSSVLFEMERWGLSKITVCHFLLCALPLLAISYLLQWNSASLLGFLIPFLIFCGIYALIWLAIFSIIRYKIQKINDCLQNISSN